MSTIKTRLTNLEKLFAVGLASSFTVVMYGSDGRVKLGSKELIGLTREEVENSTDRDRRIIHVTSKKNRIR